MRERFRFHRQVAGRSALAEVEVSVGSLGPGEISIAEGVFSWLKEEYGPDAFEWAVCDDFRAGAVEGVEFALAHCDPSVEASVEITEIRGHPAHSSRETVAYAAAHATWRALRVRGTASPQVYGVTLREE